MMHYFVAYNLRQLRAECITDHSILDTEAQLVFGVRPLDLHLDHRGTGNSCQLHHCLGLSVLQAYKYSAVQCSAVPCSAV